uniref:Uncharacterized protein n=2 Tax=Spongospora subterranea TaxID=70186 RepID=A0A0H5QZ60_9EUKA|eukprot:CRZ07273.1 hypothetical protein [Spongospora subterranea]
MSLITHKSGLFFRPFLRPINGTLCGNRQFNMSNQASDLFVLTFDNVKSWSPAIPSAVDVDVESFKAAVNQGLLEKGGPGPVPADDKNLRAHPLLKQFFSALDLWYAFVRPSVDTRLQEGTLISFHSSGLMFLGTSRNQLELLDPIGSARGYFPIEFAFLVAGFYKKFINGEIRPIPGRFFSHTAVGNADESSLMTTIRPRLVNDRSQMMDLEQECEFNTFFVDDGASYCTILHSDISAHSNSPEFLNFETSNGFVWRMTVGKFIEIDNLWTDARCAVADQGSHMRFIGLNVISRYVHHIDYRMPNPRLWRRRSDLMDQ